MSEHSQEPSEPSGDSSMPSQDPDSERCPALLHDKEDLVPLRGFLYDEEVVLLLTPVIVPPHPVVGKTSDPFEPLGRAIAQEYPLVRHVPYTKEHGITSIHVEFLKRAGLTIFVASPPSSKQLDYAKAVQDALDDCPLIVVACCRSGDTELSDTAFPTLISTPGISLPDLEDVAQLLLEGPAESSVASVASTFAPPSWKIEACDFERDLGDMYGLWSSSVPEHLQLPRSSFDQLARRNGYSFNLIVRDPDTGELVAFCVTWAAYTDQGMRSMVGYIAAIVVKEEFRSRGIGKTLHDESIARLRMWNGLYHIHFGSMFPRLFRGLPAESPFEKWLEHRGWDLSGTGLGTGQIVSDWVLKFADHPSLKLSAAGLSFRPCPLGDWQEIFTMIDTYSQKWGYFGYYDQFARNMDSAYLTNVILCYEGENLIGGIVMYLPNSDSQTAVDHVWAATAGPNLVGITCIVVRGESHFICSSPSPFADHILDDDPDMVNRRDAVVVRLIQHCRQFWEERGMEGLYLDSIRGDENLLTSLGFEKKASYREVWKKF